MGCESRISRRLSSCSRFAWRPSPLAGPSSSSASTSSNRPWIHAIRFQSSSPLPSFTLPKIVVDLNSTPGASHADVARAFNLAAHPSLSAYAALVSRIAGAEHLKSKPELIEQCCICPSFWSDLDAFHKQLPLHHQQQQQSSDQHTLFHDQLRHDNRQLSALGNALLGVFATEWLERKMPNLPTQVLKSALTMFVGPHTSADVARTWGVLPGRAASLSQQQQQQQSTANSVRKYRASSVRGQGEAWKGATGVLRWARTSSDSIVKGSKDSGLESWQNGSSFQDAMACVAKAFVGAVFQEKGLVAARDFVHAHFLSRQADIASLLKFDNPKNLLQTTLLKHNMGALETRLLRETGRLSIAPVFVVGAFASESEHSQKKIGEGLGSSLKMAEYRACEDALRRLYLAPLSHGSSRALPSDALAEEGGGSWSVPNAGQSQEGERWGSDEVEDGSSGRSGKSAAARRESQTPFAARQQMLRLMS